MLDQYALISMSVDITEIGHLDMAALTATLYENKLTYLSKRYEVIYIFFETFDRYIWALIGVSLVASVVYIKTESTYGTLSGKTKATYFEVVGLLFQGHMV